MSHDAFALGLLLIASTIVTNWIIVGHVNRIVKVLHGYREDALPVPAKEDKDVRSN
jgi:hypothetical protein